ncbi:MAG: DUF2889 domain-containing protein [Candidatus Dadabacteria bacterium]|nr:MAG: DUF2889 domain-containing protein [Candidatus Dadabacteria bacterium]
MDIFQRSIHSNVKQVDPEHLLVTSTLLDLEHSFHLELLVRLPDGVIEDAKANMTKVPLTRCLSGAEGVRELVGLTIGRGIVREITKRLGGPRGCAHMVELITDAVRLVSMILIGASVNYWDELKKTMSEEEIVAQGKKRLRNTCLVFADD